jgi:ribosomal protein L29
MELKELKQKKEKDLHRLLAETRDSLRELRFKDANKQLKNVREIRNAKRLVSRILTLLNAGKKDYFVENKADKISKNSADKAAETAPENVEIKK